MNPECRDESAAAATSRSEGDAEPYLPLTAPTSEHRPSLLVVVRHGQSLRNTFDVHAGIEKMPAILTETPDHLIPLTNTGEQQAVATARGLHDDFGDFDVIFHSPWLRTTQTAQIIERAFANDVPVRRSIFLTEQNFGQLDPALWPQHLDRYAEAYRQFEAQRKIVGKFYLRPPDGESWADVCIRTHQFLNILFRPEHAGWRVLVVTHGVTQQSFRYHLEHPTEEDLVEEYERSRNLNCGAGAYGWTPEQLWQLQFWNHVYYDVADQPR